MRQGSPEETRAKPAADQPPSGSVPLSTALPRPAYALSVIASLIGIAAVAFTMMKYLRIIEVRPSGTSWQVLVSEEMRPTYPDRAHAISFALDRARSAQAEVHVMTPAGQLEEVLRPDVSNE